jgi:hypothetical protein
MNLSGTFKKAAIFILTDLRIWNLTKFLQICHRFWVMIFLCWCHLLLLSIFTKWK